MLSNIQYDYLTGPFSGRSLRARVCRRRFRALRQQGRRLNGRTVTARVRIRRLNRSSNQPVVSQSARNTRRRVHRGAAHAVILICATTFLRSRLISSRHIVFVWAPCSPAGTPPTRRAVNTKPSDGRLRVYLPTRAKPTRRRRSRAAPEKKTDLIVCAAVPFCRRGPPPRAFPKHARDPRTPASRRTGTFRKSSGGFDSFYSNDFLNNKIFRKKLPEWPGKS